MTNKKEIAINIFQLNILLDDRQKEGYEFLLQNGVYCSTCNDNCSKGVQVKEIFITSLNDIKIQGVCNICGGKVTRIMEFGEDRAFFEKASDFKKSR